MFDNPIFFLILISLISAISEWLGKRRKARRVMEEYGDAEVEVEPGPQPEPQPSRVERRRAVQEEQSNWEERLRRMLEGEEEAERPLVERPVVREPVAVHSVPTPVPIESEPSSALATPPVISMPTTSYDDLLANAGEGIKVTRRGHRRPRGNSQIDFQSAGSIRKAIVASVVLGPPKGMEDNADILRL